MGISLPNYLFCEFGAIYIKTDYVCVFNRVFDKW